MSVIVVDVEADGPVPGLYSMVSFGAVLVDPEGKLDQTFYGELCPISDEWIPEALAVSGFSRVETMKFENPESIMRSFAEWIKEVCISRPIFYADNNGFDWSYINYYFHRFLGNNPFGFSSQNIGSLYKGLIKNMYKNFKYLRKTKHTHHPVDDAKGNAEALLYMKEEMGLNIKFN
jgi:hypothetical protein